MARRSTPVTTHATAYRPCHLHAPTRPQEGPPMPSKLAAGGLCSNRTLTRLGCDPSGGVRLASSQVARDKPHRPATEALASFVMRGIEQLQLVRPAASPLSRVRRIDVLPLRLANDPMHNARTALRRRHQAGDDRLYEGVPLVSRKWLGGSRYRGGLVAC
jgi:hypothetical protein